jgi:uncharacterized protein YkwD
MRRLWPARALVLLLALAAPVAADPVAEVLAGINAARAQAGCGPLKLNKALMSAAKTHATNMAEQDFFGHRGKDGRDFVYRIKQAGYPPYRWVAENIAAGQKTPAAAVQAWLDSPGHRRNVLNCKYVDTGIAMVYQPDDQPLKGQSMGLRWYWVQLFGLQDDRELNGLFIRLQ